MERGEEAVVVRRGELEGAIPGRRQKAERAQRGNGLPAGQWSEDTQLREEKGSTANILQTNLKPALGPTIPNSTLQGNGLAEPLVLTLGSRPSAFFYS